MKPSGFTVSGPDIDRTSGLESVGMALSYAMTAATRANSESTFYVRDADGSGVGRVERLQDKSLLIYGKTR